MSSSRAIGAVSDINEMLQQIPPLGTVHKMPTYTSREEITQRKRAVLEGTLGFLNGLLQQIKRGQEEYGEEYFRAVDEREGFARAQIGEIELKMSKSFDRHRIGEIEAALNEIGKYTEVRPMEVVKVGREQSLRILRLLPSCAPKRNTMTEYLKRKLHFEHEDVSDVELRSLGLLLKAAERLLD
jgi:hypothetical protein